jgi:isopenicillin N synthase-like dioxygenase
MTLLPQSAVEGLYIMNAEGEWVCAPKIPGAISVNSGDMLKRWSNDTVNRPAISQPTCRARTATPFPYFMAPNTQYLMESDPELHLVGEQPKHQPLRYEEYRLWFMRSN